MCLSAQINFDPLRSHSFIASETEIRHGLLYCILKGTSGGSWQGNSHHLANRWERHDKTSPRGILSSISGPFPPKKTNTCKTQSSTVMFGNSSEDGKTCEHWSSTSAGLSWRKKNICIYNPSVKWMWLFFFCMKKKTLQWKAWKKNSLQSELTLMFRKRKPLESHRMTLLSLSYSYVKTGQSLEFLHRFESVGCSQTGAFTLSLCPPLDWLLVVLTNVWWTFSVNLLCISLGLIKMKSLIWIWCVHTPNIHSIFGEYSLQIWAYG